MTNYTQAYTAWADYPTTTTPATAAKLQHMDDGIASSLQRSGGTITGALTLTDATLTEAALTITDGDISALSLDRNVMSSTMRSPGTSYTTTLRVNMTGDGIDSVSRRGIAGYFFAQDRTSVANRTITAMTRVGTTLSVSAAAHGFSTGDKVAIYGVSSTFNVDPNNTSFTISNVSTNQFDITLAGLSSGSYLNSGTATNRPMLTGVHIAVSPRITRGGLSGAIANADDFNGLTVDNVGSATATEAIYVSSNGAWYSQLTLAGNSTWGLLFSGTYTTGVFRVPSNKPIYGRNAADTADVALWRFNSSDQYQIETTMKWADSANLVLGTSTGSMIGSASAQKLGFWGATPTTRPSAYTPTNVTTDRSYDANSTSIDEIADVLGTLITDLQTVGLLG